MQKLYESLPSVDKLLRTTQGIGLVERFGHTLFVQVCREMLKKARDDIKKSQKTPHFLINDEVLWQYLVSQLNEKQHVKMKIVHNLTGTVLHTNLGRALWSHVAQQAALQAMKEHVALEYDLQKGQRSHRDEYISELLCEITGAEAACIVNNNAAAVLLMLATFALDKEVVISRGELIEIGGAFRIPDIMQQAGCRLVEVGCTNRTHLKDYSHAINENTALLMKVHTSNYQICGFTQAVEEQELSLLAKERGVLLVSDLGSGALVNLQRYGLPYEPTVQEKITTGVDLISISGDKLLGGPQAGIILGKKELIEQLQSHPLKRVLRCDKVILAGLEATLRLYLQPESMAENLSTLKLLTQTVASLMPLAQQIKTILQKKLPISYQLAIEPSLAQIGSGSQPMARLDSVAITIQASSPLIHSLLEQLKRLPQPVIGRIESGKIWLDLKGVANINSLIHTLETL